MRWLGVTDEEKMQLNTKYPLSGATKEMLGIAPESPIHPFEDKNVYASLDAEGDDAMRLEGR